MRILVIEDEHKIARSIKKGLEHENYAVDTVFDGTEGLDFALSEEYDLIVIDRLLPGMDGIEIVKKVREHGIHTPILMLTAKGQIEDKVEGLDTGADDYMVKPFAFTELFARVRALTRRPKKSTGAVLKIDNLTLNTVNYEVKREDKNIQLSSKEFSLLEYLMRHQNAIVTKEQIMNHVWSYDANVLPNSVEVYIKHLRDKIDAPFKDSSLIKTVRGFGYKISNQE
ncbi:MAG TPA: response regulator transcription factor [Patescibacteria group bacterium]|nr:response regulator transcription factor [Patescibacteria group bacterium]